MTEIRQLVFRLVWRKKLNEVSESEGCPSISKLVSQHWSSILAVFTAHIITTAGTITTFVCITMVSVVKLQYSHCPHYCAACNAAMHQAFIKNQKHLHNIIPKSEWLNAWDWLFSHVLRGQLMCPITSLKDKSELHNLTNTVQPADKESSMNTIQQIFHIKQLLLCHAILKNVDSIKWNKKEKFNKIPPFP